MYEAGGWVLVESALADIPADLRWLYESGAVTLDQLTALHCQLAITAVADLADALRRGQLLGVEGITEETAAAIAAAIPKLRASTPRIPLGRAVATVEPLLDALRGAPGIDWAEPAGSLRRGEDTVGDLELIAAAGDPSPAIDRLLNEASIIRCLHRSDRRLYLLLDRVQVGVLLPEPHAAGTLLLHRTGSARHLDLLRARAAARDVALDRPLASEEACYAALGLPYIAPELRNGDEEVARAGDNALPPLISQRDIRGDLHMHTVWSDGRDAVEEMVQASRALGYEYLAITDHSQNSAASRNLTIDGVKKQAEEIEQLRERYPDIAILHGCEVDILPDGRLDFPDRVLERFDIVLASLHDHAGQPPEQLMNRYESALSHPLVSVITHPTNRLVPHRRGYDLDYDRLFELAVHTGTALEIDGSPSHLDLDGALARRAIAAGATVSIDSDGHRADLLARQMHLGIVLARRGWVEPRHVLNTRPLADVRGFIAGKRAGR
jgi:DNA polymerase (family 10)